MNCDVSAQQDAARCFRCIPKGSRREVWIYLLCQIDLTGLKPPPPCILPPSFTISGWNISNNSLQVIIGWKQNTPGITIDHFVINYGTAGAAGPFPNTINAPTGVVPSGPPYLNQSTTSPLIAGLVAGTTYYFQIIAVTNLNCPGDATYTNQTTSGSHPETSLVIDDGAGGFWGLTVDTEGNLGTFSTVGPASAPMVLADGSGGFWLLVVDPSGMRGATSDPGPAGSGVVLTDGLGFHWEIVVDDSGNVGTLSVP